MVLGYVSFDSVIGVIAVGGEIVSGMEFGAVDAMVNCSSRI
jgi:hypothetical protein